MTNADRYTLINLYVCQFGRINTNGSGYIIQILQRYTDHGFSFGAADLDHLMSDTAKERGIQRDSILDAIRHYLKDGWERGFCDAWRKQLGWSQSGPPDAAAAVEPLCRSYADFEKMFEAGRRRGRESLREEPSGEQEPGAASPALEPKSLADEIIGSSLFLSLEEELTEVYACYLTYHVQREFYELCLERGLFSNLSWERFIFSMRHCKQARDAAAAVLLETIKGFWANGSFNFDAADEPMSYSNLQK